MRRAFSVILSALLCAALLLSTVAFAIDGAPQAPLQVGVLSDVHYFAEKMTGNWCDAFMQFTRSSATQRYETPALLDSALAALTAHAEENGMKYVLMPGDLTANGEYDAHVELAERLERFEQETGLSVIVINGNHDINNSNGFTFESGKMQPARITTPDEFREIYENLGYDLAYHTYTPQSGRAGALSYSVRLDGGYRLIVLDVNIYSSDVTKKGTDEHETGGAITDGLMEWALSEIEDAKACGEAVIGMEHHSIVEHFKLHSSIFKLFVVDDWQERAEAFADAGLSYMLTGHLHDTSITEWVSDSGSVLYDISTPTLTGYPNCFREIRFDNADGLTADVETFDVDCVQPVTVRGETYAQPYKTTFSFGQTYKNGLADLAMSFLGIKMDELFDTMETEGSLLAALKTLYHLDVEELLSHYVDVRLGSIEIFTMRNVMSFLDDLDAQLRRTLLTSREDAEALVRELIQSLADFQVSDLPCTKYIDTFGFGDPNKPGTLQDAAYSALVVLYGGNQTIDDDPFMQDVLDFFRNRDGAKKLFDLLYDVLLNDLVQDRLLGQLQFNIDTLFPTGTLGHVSMKMLDGMLSLVFRGDKSYANVINSVLGLGLIPGMLSINGIADHFIGEYMTQSQFDGMGATIADMIGDIVTDHGDGEDLTRHLTDAPHAVEATRENYRLPTILTVTTGEDAATERNISWYTKFSVTGSDIEIVPYSTHPSFSGTPTRSGVQATSERDDRYYPGVDLGVLGFMDTKVPLTRHTVRLTGLKPGQKVCYRVGDAEKGWWSEPGVLETADGSQDVTFLHVTDPQSQNAVQYERFHSVLQTAFSLYPETDLVVSSGDQVDNGENVRQWQALTDVSSDVLSSTVFMPATGNHEKSGGVLGEYFVLPGVPEQDTDSGVYYAYDYNNVHFMVLNTNDTTSKEGLSDAQLAWLRQSAEASDAQWKVVVLHKAVYSNGSHFDDKEVEAMRKQFKCLFPQLGIDMVLEGHDHVYLRTDAMFANLVVKSKTKTVSFGGRDYSMKIEPYGTFYVISGTAGVKNYVPKSSRETALKFPHAEGLSDLQLPMFSAVQIRGNNLYFDAYAVQADGSAQRIDSFAVEKSGKRTSILPVIYENNGEVLGPTEGLEDTALVRAADDELEEMDLLPGEQVPVVRVTDPDKLGNNSGAADSGTGSSGSDSNSSDSNSSGSSGSNSSGSDSNSSGSSGTGSNGSGNNGTGNNGSGSNGTGNNGTGNSGTGNYGTGSNGSGSNGSGSSGSGNYGTGSNGSGNNGTGNNGTGISGYGSNGSGNFGIGNNGSGSSGSNSIGGRYGTGQRVPRLGGSTPFMTVSVLFGAILVGMWARTRKEQNDE